MEVTEDRGIECKGLCFNYVNGSIVIAVYQNLPGIKRELAGTTFQKSFSPSEWEEVNRYLIETLDKAEGVFSDVEEEDSNKEKVEEGASG